VVEKIKKKIEGRKIIFPLVIVALVAIGVGVLLIKPKVELPSQAPAPTNATRGAPTTPGTTTPTPTEGVKVKCPADYCGPIVCGAGPCPQWTGKVGAKCETPGCCLPDGTQRYYEQLCYDYPEEAVDCEAVKTSYYLICGLRPA
jgi:hypothetical protein